MLRKSSGILAKKRIYPGIRHSIYFFFFSFNYSFIPFIADRVGEMGCEETCNSRCDNKQNDYTVTARFPGICKEFGKEKNYKKGYNCPGNSKLYVIFPSGPALLVGPVIQKMPLWIAYHPGTIVRGSRLKVQGWRFQVPSSKWCGSWNLERSTFNF